MHALTYVFVRPSILQFQFIKKGFKQTEQSEHSGVLVLFLSSLDKNKGGVEEENDEEEETTEKRAETVSRNIAISQEKKFTKHVTAQRRTNICTITTSKNI